MKIKFKTVLAVALAVLMCVLAPMQALAISDAEDYVTKTSPETLETQLKDKTIGVHTGKTTLYISDIKIVTGKTADEAKKALHDAGYLVYDDNLNEGTGKDCTYIGYRITTDKSKAITNIYTMDEGGGYDKFSYKKFAESGVPGLQDLVIGMRESCKQMREKLNEGSYAATVAKEYLDLFCVPKTSTEKTGEKLGDYLLNPKRTDEDYRDLLLVLGTLELSVINVQLAIGISDSGVKQTQAKGGFSSNGYVVTTYTSNNGITGYTGLTDNNGWLKNAAIAMQKDSKFADVNRNDDSEYFAKKLSEYGGQITAIRRAFSDNTISADAVNYLKSEILESSKGTVSTMLGTNNCTAYDLLTKGSNRMLCLFLAELPEVCYANRFIDALEICATDCEHRLPVDYTYNKLYDIDWVPSVVDSINAELIKPSDKSVYNAYNNDIESFVNLFTQFTDEYEKAIEKYDKDKTAPMVDSKSDTPEKAEKIVESVIKNQTAVDSPSHVYYAIIREYFSRYTVQDGTKTVSLIDYLISATKGKKASDESVKARIYPVVKALSTAKKYAYKSCGMLTFFMSSLLGTNELAVIEAMVYEKRLQLEKGYGSKDCSIWANSNKDLIERDGDSGIAMTSQRVMDTLNSKKMEEAFPRGMADWKSYQNALIGCGAALCGALALGAITIAAVKVTLAFGGFAMVQGASMFGSLFATASSMAAFACCALTVIVVAALVVIAVVVIVFLILFLVAFFKTEPTPEYTQIPDIMLDCIEDKNNYVTSICRYNVVTDLSGKPADINAFSARKWIALYYTKNPDAGSPLTLGEDGEFFASTKGYINVKYKSVPLTKFLTASNYNLNSHCYSDSIYGKYLYFYTEDSLKGIHHQTTGVYKYIDSIMIGHSNKAAGTMAYLLKKKGYQLLYADLSPNCGAYNTYIAFHTTDDKSSAVTDIRAAYNTTAKNVWYGDNSYYSILDETMRKIPAITCEDSTQSREKTSFNYGLYVSKSTAVGDPLLSSGIGYVTDLSEVPEGAEVISYFAGMPLDFNSYDGEGFYKDSEGNYIYDKHVYVYFKSERDSKVDYTNKTYLSGMATFVGSQDWLQGKGVDEWSLQQYASKSFGCNLIDEIGCEMGANIYNNDQDKQYFGYVWTHNPKRALTDLAVFTGEPKSGILPQNIALPKVGYCVCDVYTQGDYNFYGSGGGYWQRKMRLSHAYFTAEDSEHNTYTWPKNVAVMSRGLYASGPQTNVKPIELSDVVVSAYMNYGTPSQVNAYSKEGYIADYACLTTTGLRYHVKKQVEGWHSVHPIDQYYYDKYDANGALLSSYDIGLGANEDNSDTSTGSMYIFYRNGTGPRIRGNYISNVALTGSLTAGYAYNEARISALAAGEDIVNLARPMSLDNNTFNDMALNRETYYGMTKGLKVDYNDSCILLSASYTDDPAEAIGSVRIMKQGYQLPVIPTSMSLPLYDLSKRTSAFSQTGMAPIEGTLGSTYEGKQAKYGAYISYVSHDGTPINRVALRIINTTPSQSIGEYNGGSGAAEYYAQYSDTLDPFLFEIPGTGQAAAICLMRNIENGRNEDYYIMDITAVEATSADGNMTMAAAKLGAMGYPYMIDFDIAESALSYGSNAVAALGIKRTTDPNLAIKDIKLSPDDLGESYIYKDMRYHRANDKPILIEGTGNGGVYIYTTDGSDSRMILWKDVDKDNTDWETFDWYHLDFTRSGATDLNFTKEIGSILKKHPAILGLVNEITDDENKSAERTARLEWAKKTAITNIGFIPSSECPEQQSRKFYGKTVKDIYWAGCPAYGTDQLPVAVTPTTTAFSVSAFGSNCIVTGLRVTNAGNCEFTLYESPSDTEAGISASIFTQRNIIILSVLSAVFLIALAVLYILYKKKIIGKREK